MLIDQVAKIAKSYFPNFSLDVLSDLMMQLPLDEPGFTQVRQFENKPQLEVGFRSGAVLVDFTYRSEAWLQTVLTIAQIDQFQFTRSASESKLMCRAGAALIMYTASADTSRVQLERYWRSVLRVLNR